MKTNTIDAMIVKCAECGDAYSVNEVNDDKVRFFLNGQAVRFLSGTTLDLINEQSFLCECCEEDRLEQEDYPS